MMFATLDDLEGSVEMLVFGKALAEYEAALAVDEIVLVHGRVDHKDAGKTRDRRAGGRAVRRRRRRRSSGRARQVGALAKRAAPQAARASASTPPACRRA